VDARVLQVGRHRHARDRHEPDAGVVDVARQHQRDFPPDLIGDAVWSGALSH